MKDFGLAALMFLGLSSFFIVAWLGALVGRKDRPVGIYVKKHNKVILIGLAVGHLATTFFDESEIAHRLDLAIIMVAIALFVPLLRSFEKNRNQGEVAR